MFAHEMQWKVVNTSENSKGTVNSALEISHFYSLFIEKGQWICLSDI